MTGCQRTQIEIGQPMRWKRGVSSAVSKKRLRRWMHGTDIAEIRVSARELMGLRTLCDHLEIFIDEEIFMKQLLRKDVSLKTGTVRILLATAPETPAALRVTMGPTAGAHIATVVTEIVAWRHRSGHCKIRGKKALQDRARQRARMRSRRKRILVVRGQTY